MTEDDPVPAKAPPADGAGFVDWVRPHLPAMARVAARLAVGADRDDIVQEALTRAWLKRDQYDGTRGTASSWLLAITADQARKAVRRLRPVAELTESRPTGTAARCRGAGRCRSGARRAVAAATAGRRLLLLRGPVDRRHRRGDGLLRRHRQVNSFRCAGPLALSAGGQRMKPTDKVDDLLTRPAPSGARASRPRPSQTSTASPAPSGGVAGWCRHWPRPVWPRSPPPR